MLSYIFLVKYLHLPTQQSPQLRADYFLLLGLSFPCTTPRTSPPVSADCRSGATRSVRRFTIISWLALSDCRTGEVVALVNSFDCALEAAE